MEDKFVREIYSTSKNDLSNIKCFDYGKVKKNTVDVYHFEQTNVMPKREYDLQYNPIVMKKNNNKYDDNDINLRRIKSDKVRVANNTTPRYVNVNLFRKSVEYMFDEEEGEWWNQ